MIRIIVRTVDIGAAANVGGPPNVTYETFDVDVPVVEASLREKFQWSTREVVGIELLPEAPKEGT